MIPRFKYGSFNPNHCYQCLERNVLRQPEFELWYRESQYELILSRATENQGQSKLCPIM